MSETRCKCGCNAGMLDANVGATLVCQRDQVQMLMQYWYVRDQSQIICNTGMSEVQCSCRFNTSNICTMANVGATLVCQRYTDKLVFNTGVA